MQIEAYLYDAIAKFGGTPADQIRPETRLADLELDSLTVAEILVELEIQLDRELPVDVLRRLDEVQTVGDVAAELQAALDEPAAGSRP